MYNNKKINETHRNTYKFYKYQIIIPQKKMKINKSFLSTGNSCPLKPCHRSGWRRNYATIWSKPLHTGEYAGKGEPSRGPGSREWTFERFCDTFQVNNWKKSLPIKFQKQILHLSCEIKIWNAKLWLLITATKQPTKIKNKHLLSKFLHIQTNAPIYIHTYHSIDCVTHLLCMCCCVRISLVLVIIDF